MLEGSGLSLPEELYKNNVVQDHVRHLEDSGFVSTVEESPEMSLSKVLL
jgi:hypothetical protein